MDWRTEEILIIVKAYPTPSSKYGETVCTAGITKFGKWIRLYPVPYRDLPPEKQYKKFQWIRAQIKPTHEKLQRPESHKIDIDSIEVLDVIPSGAVGWRKRKEYFLPLVSKSLEELERKKEKDKISLGAFKPLKVKDFIIEASKEAWTAKKQAIVGQSTLLHIERTPLEKIPYTFHYKFICNDFSCPSHEITIIDWETGESYRNFKKIYKDEKLTLKKMREKWFDYFFNQRESYFVVGTDFQWSRFIILTIVSPERKQSQLPLEF